MKGLSILGTTIIIGLWFLIDFIFGIPKYIIPNPLEIVLAFIRVFGEKDLFGAIEKSVTINLGGYLEALLISVPLGFLFGKSKYMQKLFMNKWDLLRYLPLSAITGIFLSWFGIGMWMKTHFLAFGLLVYLTPAIAEEVKKIPATYINCAKTLGATKWKQFWTIEFPFAMSCVSDQLRILVAISWTYITIVEIIVSTGGLGYLTFMAGRNSKIDEAFVYLGIILGLGFLLDYFIKLIDRLVLAWKYE